MLQKVVLCLGEEKESKASQMQINLEIWKWVQLDESEDQPWAFLSVSVCRHADADKQADVVSVT